MKLNQSHIVFPIYLLLFFFGIATFVYFSNDINEYRNDRYFTIYDSNNFYHMSQNVNKLSDLKFYQDYHGLVYKGYPVYLMLYKSFLNNFFDNLSYKQMIFANIFLLIICVIIYFQVFKPQKISELIPILIVSIEPALLSFSLTLEREVFASLILALCLLSCVFLDGIKRIVVLCLFIYIAINVRLEIALIPFLTFFIFWLINFGNSEGFKIHRFLLISSVLLILFGLLIWYGGNLINWIKLIIELQLKGTDKSGFGGIILGFPLPIRVFAFSFLFFFSPLPAFSLINEEFMFPYEYILIFSGISYLGFWIFILKNYMFFTKKIKFLVLGAIISHVIFGGLLFNIRHRVDIIVVLMIVFLLVIRVKKESVPLYNIIKEFGMCISISFTIVLFLSIFIMIIK